MSPGHELSSFALGQDDDKTYSHLGVHSRNLVPRRSKRTLSRPKDPW